MPDQSTPLVNVAVRWDVGSREDPPGKAGLAHVVEHLMFQPRPDGNNSPPLFQSIIELAVGDFNAYTNEDTTHYYETVRAENMDDAIKIEAMRQFYFLDTITEIEFERERDVVRNEIRQRGGTAEGQIDQLVLDAIYPKGHAYANTVGGNDAQLSSITLQDAKDFVKKYYAPERATVLVAGGFEPEAAVASIQKWFGKLEKRDPAPRVAVAPVAIEPGTKTFDLDIDRPKVGIAFALPAWHSPEGEAVGFGLQKAFFRTLVASAEYDFATSVQPRVLGGQLAPVFMIEVELKDISKVDEALEFLKKATADAHRGLDTASKLDLEEEENLQKADYIEGLESLGARTNAVADLVQFDKDVNFDSGDVYVFHRLDKFSKFDGDFVAKVVKQYIDFDKAKVFVIKANANGIKGDTRTSMHFDKQSDEAIINPDVDPAEAMHPIKVKSGLGNLTAAQHITLDNGMNVILLPVHAMPIVSGVMLYKNVGKASTPDNPALAGAAATFLHLPIDAEAFAKTGIGVECEADEDNMTCESQGISLYLDTILHGFERIVATSDYSQEAVEKWLKRTKDRAATRTYQERIEFQRQVDTAFYGADHPYSVTDVITKREAEKVHKDALDEFRKSHYSAGNATLILVGDFDPKTAEASVRDVFGKWSKGTVPPPVGKASAARTGPLYVGVIAKEEPQVLVVMGYPSPAGIDGQQAARNLVGDLLQARVDDVRFKLGTTYGMGARHDTRHGPSRYVIGGTVDAERAGESIKAIRDGIDAAPPRRELRGRLRSRAPQAAPDVAQRLDGHRRDREPPRPRSRASASTRTTSASSRSSTAPHRRRS